MIDKLIERIAEKQSPICVGLDTKFDYIPQEFLSREFEKDALTYAAANIFLYNRAGSKGSDRLLRNVWLRGNEGVSGYDPLC